MELIGQDPNKFDGKAFLIGTKLPVWAIVKYMKAGQSKEYILRGFPSLTEAGFNAASEYYNSHKSEIDLDIRASEDTE